jgi:preprotein translocase subunit YajC
MKRFVFSALILCNSLAIFAQDKAAPKAGKSDPMTFLIMMAVIFAIIYFLMILPQKKKQKETQNMLNNMKKGDKIVTIGGVLGTIGNVKETTVMVKIAENTVVEIRKSAVATILNDDKAAEKTEKTEKDEKTEKKG